MGRRHITGGPCGRRGQVELRGLLALVSVMCAASTAWAGGYHHPDNGPEALGRGGAWVAGVNNASALYFNPANLALLEGFDFYLGSNFSLLDVEFAREGLDRRILPEPDGSISVSFGERRNTPFEPVRRSCELAALCTPMGFAAPMLFAGYGGDGWGAGIGVFGPPGVGSSEYPEDGAQRFGLVRQELSLMWLSAGGAYRMGPVRVGASFMMGRLDVLYKVKLDASVVPLASTNASLRYHGESSDNYVQTTDLPMELSAGAWAPAGILAAAYDVTPELSLALTVQTVSQFDAQGNMALEFEKTDIDETMANLSDDAVQLDVVQPWIVKLGGIWSYGQGADALFDIELNVVYESWSLNDELRLNIPGGFGDPSLGPITPIGAIALEKNWKDVFSVRLGSDIHVQDWWTARLGSFVESGAVPVETSNLDVFSYNRLGVGVGSTFKTPWGIDVALGYEHIFQAERVVSDSDLRVTIPLSQCIEPYADATVCEDLGTPPGDPVGDGVINADFDIVSVAVIGNY